MTEAILQPAPKALSPSETVALGGMMAALASLIFLGGRVPP